MSHDAASTPATADVSRATRHGIRAKLVTLSVAAVLIVVCMGDGFLWWNNRSDSQAQAAESAATAAANDSIPLLLSYNYVDLDRYAARATSKTTGPFADDLNKLLDTQVLPAARAKNIATQTTVQATSTVTASAETAVLLMFIDQTTRTADAAAPKIEGARLQITMTNQNGSWLISGLKPI
jgi:Mce-associated membrane protein